MNAEAATAPPAALAMHQTFHRPLEAETVRVAAGAAVAAAARVARAGGVLEGGPHRCRCGSSSDPRRTDLALIDPQSRLDVTAIRWAPSSRPVFGGMRPAAVDWVRMPAPRWFAEEGWALTPETAGMARLMGRGPHLGPITARVRRDRPRSAC